MFYQTNNMQAADISPPPGSDGMVQSAAAWYHLQQVRSILSLPVGGWSECTVYFCPWWPTFDLDIETCPSEGPNTSSMW